jgi:1,4-alpha-glucan branching enzyme
MIRKAYSKDRRNCRVTFSLPTETGAQSVHLVGDFNEWSRTSHPIPRRKDGRFSLTLSLRPGRYAFRYLMDGARWANDEAADAYEPNPYGGDNSIVEV